MGNQKFKKLATNVVDTKAAYKLGLEEAGDYIVG